MMRRFGMIALAAGIALGGCRDRDNRTDLRTLDADELARQGKLTLADSQVVAALRSPTQVGRIIYDAPQDLSLATAQRTRRDLFPSDSARVNPASGTARRDSTGGDATADTSGGAAKARRPRP